MTLSVLFYVAAGITTASALLVVLNRNAVYSAVLLVLAFFSLALIFLLLDAYFLAIIEILVYAGAIMVLFLFVIMLLNVRREEAVPKLIQLQRALSLFLIVVFFLGVMLLMTRGMNVLHQTSLPSSVGNVGAVGEALFSTYLFPFEVASLLLLVALIGTVYLAKRNI